MPILSFVKQCFGWLRKVHARLRRTMGTDNGVTMMATRDDDLSRRLPARLKLHARHSVLRKMSTALRVRISPSMDIHGSYIVIDDVTPEEVSVIAQILGD